MIYNSRSKDTYNHKGMIATLDPSVYERTMGLLGDMGVAK